MEAMPYRLGLELQTFQAPIGEAAPVGRTPPPRGKGGTQPGRISCVRNMGTPTESGAALVAGR